MSWLLRYQDLDLISPDWVQKNILSYLYRYAKPGHVTPKRYDKVSVEVTYTKQCNALMFDQHCTMLVFALYLKFKPPSGLTKDSFCLHYSSLQGPRCNDTSPRARQRKVCCYVLAIIQFRITRNGIKDKEAEEHK